MDVLSTLASIKSQVTSALHQIQQVNEGTMSSSSSSDLRNPPPEEGRKGEDVTDDGASALSRNEVRAQREAKKAAKQARKTKSLAGGDKGEGVKQENDKPATPGEGKAQGKTEKKKPGGPGPQPEVKKAENTNKDTPSKQQQPVKGKTPDSSKIKESPPPPAAAPASTPPPPSKANESIKVPPTKSKSAPPSFDSLVEKVHPKFKELGLKFSHHVIHGSNQRTIALLETTKAFILSYRTPEGKGFKQDISAQLQLYFDKLKLYRPYAVGMSTAVDGINSALRGLEEGLTDSEYKEDLQEWCDRFIEEKINKAVEAIGQNGCEKIQDGDTVLAYSITDSIYETFKLAGKSGKRFNLLLALARGNNSNHASYLIREYERIRDVMGKDIFGKLVNVSIINWSSVMTFISSVDKVFLGGHALFTTGGVMAHAGSSTIALCAQQHNIPVIFFCETYKFCDKSPTDAFYSDVFPENKFGFKAVSGDHEEHESVISSKDGEGGLTEDQIPNSAKICYDVTPVNLVTCVITDIDMLPSSSVPVVLRVQESRPLTKCPM